jgi:GDP-4-dehydro-6-deoxy-D-mannose reductase
MRALVIGADGFAGRWLTKHLVHQGDRVVAGVGPRFVGPEPDAHEVARVDVTDRVSLETAIRASKPDITYYLAGAGKRGSREALASAVGVTVAGSAQTLACLSQHAPGSRMLFVSSGYVYGSLAEPQDETAAVAPTEAYGAAKLAAEQALWPIAHAGGVSLAVARPFNHIGRGQKMGFLVPTVASQLREVETGRRPTLTVGALDEVRDFSDVRDVVRGYRLIATAEEEGTWNLASGVGMVIGDLIGLMARLAGVQAEVVSKPPAHPYGPKALVGDATRLRAMGWRPEHRIEDTLREVVEEHRMMDTLPSPVPIPG